MEKKINFKNSKGDMLVGIVNNPSQGKNRPIIVLAHGLRSSKESGTYTTLSEKLAEKNISSFRFDFYGHGESEGKFENVTFTEAIDDLEKAIEYLKTLGYTKIGVMGSSFGGLASLIVASKRDDLILLALKSPVSNYSEKEEGTKEKEKLKKWKEKGYRYYEDENVGKVKLNYSFYKDAQKYNAYNVAPDIKAPTLIVHGDKDEVVPYEQSVKTCKLIPNCRLVTVEDGDHRYSNPKDKEEMWHEMADFIEEKTK